MNLTYPLETLESVNSATQLLTQLLPTKQIKFKYNKISKFKVMFGDRFFPQFSISEGKKLVWYLILGKNQKLFSISIL